MFKSVKEFHLEVLKNIVADKGLMNAERLALTKRKLHEEIDEIVEAHDNQDYIGAIDGHIDLIYFAIGGLHDLGLSAEEMEQCFQAVHSCNMTKRKGTVVRDGVASDEDAVKPTDWVGPEERIAAIIGEDCEPHH